MSVYWAVCNRKSNNWSASNKAKKIYENITETSGIKLMMLRCFYVRNLKQVFKKFEWFSKAKEDKRLSLTWAFTEVSNNKALNKGTRSFSAVKIKTHMNKRTLRNRRQSLWHHNKVLSNYSIINSTITAKVNYANKLSYPSALDFIENTI